MNNHPDIVFLSGLLGYGSVLKNLSSPSTSMITSVKASMQREFNSTDFGRMTYFLGVEAIQRGDKIFINHSKYAKEVVDRLLCRI